MCKVSLTQDHSRKIDNPSYNTYVSEGIESHQATQVAPSALLQPFSKALENQLISRFKSVKEQLTVVERVIKASSNPTELILDPFAGSASTGIAAIGLGRIFLGFEIRQDYCEIAVERFKIFQQQKKDSLAYIQGSLF